jgi:uncharacterized protein (UPF0210 family)
VSAGTRLPKVRALTAGVDLESFDDLQPAARAIDLVARARARLEREGFEVQLGRLALPPLLARVAPSARPASLARVRELDALVGAAGMVLSVGPLVVDDAYDPALAGWIAELVAATQHTFTSVAIASPDGGVHRQGARVAAEAIDEIAANRADPLGNFRFAAAAQVPAGTPFFPVAYHHGAPSIAAGLESAHLVHDAVLDAAQPRDVGRRLIEVLGPALMGVERVLDGIAHDERVQYLGLDTSPAPLGAANIAAAIEALANAPFGHAGTLDACAMLTGAIKALPVRSCGYCGLMLPVLEDDVLAARASEGRYGIRELLLYSSVCGTGLDVVPIPGHTPTAALERLLLDVAALATRLDKPLSARLLPARGLKPGDMTTFENQYLTNARVLAV